jgi:hypothetical protein
VRYRWFTMTNGNATPTAAPELTAARSWVKKPLKDAYASKPAEGEIDARFGWVVDALETEDGVRLVARFPGEEAERLIALEPTVDGHYLYPKDVKSRYRGLSETDRDELKALVAARRAA